MLGRDTKSRMRNAANQSASAPMTLHRDVHGIESFSSARTLLYVHLFRSGPKVRPQAPFEPDAVSGGREKSHRPDAVWCRRCREGEKSTIRTDKNCASKIPKKKKGGIYTCTSLSGRARLLTAATSALEQVLQSRVPLVSDGSGSSSFAASCKDDVPLGAVTVAHVRCHGCNAACRPPRS